MVCFNKVGQAMKEKGPRLTELLYWPASHKGAATLRIPHTNPYVKKVEASQPFVMLYSSSVVLPCKVS